MVNMNYREFESYFLPKLITDIRREWEFQDFKFPKQVHDIHEWMSIIMEEIGEISREALELESNDFNTNKLKEECIQAITLLIRITYSSSSIRTSNKKLSLII